MASPAAASQCRLVACVLSVGLLLAAAAGVPSRGQQSPPAAVEVMEVVLVNVEVWVHDRDGRAIRGLSAGDFEVLEDGEPVPITHFAEVVEQTPGATTAPPPPADVPDEPDTAPSAVDEPGYLVLYFDQLHLTAATTRRRSSTVSAL